MVLYRGGTSQRSRRRIGVPAALETVCPRPLSGASAQTRSLAAGVAKCDRPLAAGALQPAGSMRSLEIKGILLR